jgi:Tol biopolymer transport system component
MAHAVRLCVGLVLAAISFAVVGSAARPAGSGRQARNGRIVFVRATGTKEDLYSVRADGTDLRRLTRDPEGASSPAVSPNGRRIAFVSMRNFRTSAGDIWVMNADGTRQTRLTSDVADEADPAWSPDGKKIVFDLVNSGRSDLYVMDADGSHRRRLTATPQVEGGPAWSPNGKKIAFARIPSPYNTAARIYTVNPDGSGLRELSSKPYEGGPSWSPDSRRIAFERGGDIYLMNADGTHRHRLTWTTSLEEAPAWSPDGRTVAFVSDRSGDTELWQIDVDGTRPRQLTRHAHAVLGKIAWQRLP